MSRKRKTLSQLSITNDLSLASKKQRPDEIQKRAGTINRMILKNFMCHSHLEVDLSENNIDIIIGRNGSGKSAILTALVVGLGGKASLTNRGKSIKGFVKAGKNSGSVEIELYNGGPMAYRPKVYGEKITIVRNFTASGGSTYKVKSESGEVIAKQVKEIQNITTSLNIQVENPVCILNQDTSRNFLSSNDPKHKFTLFMRATRLESLSEEYKTIDHNKREAVRIFENRQSNFQKLHSDLQEIKTKIDNQRSVVSLRDKIKTMQEELLWAKVRDAEEDAKKVQQSVETWERKHEALLAERADKEERIKNMADKIKGLQQQLKELEDTIKVQSRPQHDVKNTVNSLKVKLEEKKRERQFVASSIESKTKDVDYLKGEIKNVNENMTRIEQEKMQRLRDLNTKNEKIKAAEDHLQTCRNDLYQLSSDLARREDEKQTLRQDITKLEQQIQQARSSLNALRKETGNSLLLYGDKTLTIKQLIEQNKHKFKHVPRGPLGSYIKLKDKKWAIAVESYLTSSLLKSFTVDNKEDNVVLNRIFSQACPGQKPTVLISKFFFQKHNVQPNLAEAPKDCISLYNSIEVEDPVVSNCLVDQAATEGILLIPSNDRAMQLLSNVATVPQNCRQGITMQGDKYFPDPSYKTYASTYHRAQFLQVDTKEHITQLEQNIQELEHKKQSYQNQYRAICTDVRDQETKKTQLEEKIRKLNTARTEIRRELEQLKAMPDPETANVEQLETELMEIQSTLQESHAQLAQVDEAIKEIRGEIQKNEEKLRSLKDANSSLEDRMQLLDRQIREETTSQKEIRASDEFDRKRLRDFEERLAEARREWKKREALSRQFTEQAESLGERQETDRKQVDIVAEINQLEISVRRIEIATEDSDELLKKYNVLSEKLKKLSSLLSSLQEDVLELTTAVGHRGKVYKLTERYFVTFIQHSFKKIMHVRQFQGSIEINMQEKKLELIVIPHHGSQGITTTSNLSGGERSFSTVAFLYSLWQCMEFPFYFLDEFDVYMDKLNRSKVIEILLHHAETHPELQFVFLTPQDISFIKKNVTILRLQDPERNRL